MLPACEAAVDSMAPAGGDGASSLRIDMRVAVLARMGGARRAIGVHRPYGSSAIRSWRGASIRAATIPAS